MCRAAIGTRSMPSGSSDDAHAVSSASCMWSGAKM
jgi:hypothetical protein